VNTDSELSLITLVLRPSKAAPYEFHKNKGTIAMNNFYFLYEITQTATTVDFWYLGDFISIFKQEKMDCTLLVL
jgi:hypothetical protein